MIKYICESCIDTDWVIRLKDNDSELELKGCKRHIDEFHNEILSIKNLEKLSIDKVLNQLNL